MRKLRRFLYNHTSKKYANLGISIQKLHHGNMNKLDIIADSCKYETALTQRVEKLGNLSVDFDKALRMDKPKNKIYEITPGFLKDTSPRVVYEALKVNKNST